MPLAGPKKALVLSAGGAFAAYQAGAWEVLATRFSPDIVVGASAGSLNAWAVAGGATPRELTESWLDPACAAGFTIRRRPGLTMYDPGPLYARIEALWKAYRPRIEVGIVTLELPRLRPRLFRDGEIGWRHLAASCALPFGYPPVRLEGKLYVDGGLLEALPLWAAAEMGATEIMAIDVFDRGPSSPLRAAIHAFRALLPRPPRLSAAVEVHLIVPSRSLGPLRQSASWDPKAVQGWLALGRADAARAAEP
jgi:predicted acylesterase/phospholipase RssA